MNGKKTISKTLKFKDKKEVSDFINNCEDNGYEFIQTVYYKHPNFLSKGAFIGLFENKS